MTDKLIEKYRKFQEGITPSDGAVEDAIDKAVHGKRKSVRPRFAVAAAAAALCVCMSVTGIAGIVNEVRKKSRVEEFVDARGINNEYVQYPEITLELKSAKITIDRYVKVDDYIVIDITMKNTNQKPAEKYMYSAGLTCIGADGKLDDLGSMLKDSTVLEIGKEFSAEENSVSLSYMIKNPSEKILVHPSSMYFNESGMGEIYNAAYNKAKENTAYLPETDSETVYDISGKTQDEVAKIFTDSGRYMLLDTKNAPVYHTGNSGIHVKLESEDVKKCMEHYPDNAGYDVSGDLVEYDIVPFELIITDFGVVRQFKYKELVPGGFDLERSGAFTPEGKVGAFASGRFKWVWTPASIVLEYDDGTKELFSTRAGYSSIPKADLKGMERISIFNNFTAWALDGRDAETISDDEIYRQYGIIDGVINTSKIKKVIIDGVEFNVK
ncbi:MAG: hypothetical protein ACI4EJ_04895 [Bacteroides sp.]